MRMMHAEFDIITFDCYGTLIDWESGIITAFQTEAAKDGVELDAERIVAAYAAEEAEVESEGYRLYREVLAETARRAAGRLGWKISPQRASFLAESLESWKPFRDTNSALEKLANKHSLGILSNVDNDLLAATRRHFTVDFDLIVTAEQVRSYKPGFAHFKEAIARAGQKRLLHSAQSYFHDVVPASKLDIPVVWVNRKGERIEQGGPPPMHEVRDLAGLVDLLGDC